MLKSKLNLFEKSVMYFAELNTTNTVLHATESNMAFLHAVKSAGAAEANNDSYANTCLLSKPICNVENIVHILQQSKKGLYKGELVLTSYYAPNLLAKVLNLFCKDKQGNAVKKYYTKKEILHLVQNAGFQHVRCCIMFGYVAVCTAWVHM